MDVPLRLLIVEDSVEDTFLIVRRLQQGGFTVTFERVETAVGLREALRAQAWDLVISDYSMPGFTGDAALAVFQQAGLEIPFIVVSGAIGEEVAVQILKAGAHEFVKKDNLARLVPAIRQELAAAADRRMRLQSQALSEYLASIVQSCEDAIIGKTVEGTIVSWNSGAERLYGYTATEMIGQSVSRLIPPYRPDELPDMVEKLRRGESVEDLETVRIRKDGVPIEVSVTISPVRGPDGSIIGASSVARDISRRKKEENERLMLIRDLTTALSGTQS
jgi:two-component system, cell cycle sensor histidine kinase and response regulator CckA